MSITAFEANFHGLCHNDTQLLTTKEDGIWHYAKGLNYNLQYLSAHMTSVGKRFNKVLDYVKKLEGLIQVGQNKMLAKQSCNIWTFSGSFFKVHG